MENIKRSKLVVLDNRIVDSICPLKITEKRVLYLLLSKISNGYRKSLSKKEIFSDKNIAPEDVIIGKRVEGEVLSSEYWYRLSVREFSEVTQVRLDNARTELQDVVESLRTKYVKIDYGSGMGYVKVNWVSAIMFDVKDDCIGIKWNTDILPFICDLEEYFVKLKLQELLLLKSTYSWKLHEVLKLLRGMQDFNKAVVIPVDELKRLLNVPDGFQAYKYFKSKVLTPAVKELNNKKVYTQLIFREIKSGKSVVRLEWSWLTIKEIEKRVL
jgi:plasmid replication initiation protein